MTTSSPPPPPPAFAALIGIDWACAQHALCTYDCASGQIERSTLAQTPEAIAAWAQSLRERYGGRQLALCLEQAKGPLIYALMTYEFLTLYPVNPATSARYRQAFKTSRAKDDPDDAQVCMELYFITAPNSLPGGRTIPPRVNWRVCWKGAAARSICAPCSATCCVMP